MIRIAVIIGSIRPGRRGEAVARWVDEVAGRHSRGRRRPHAHGDPGLEAERAAGFGDALDAYAAGLPLGRLGHPDDVARVVLFAASDLAAYVSGSVIAADGGDVAR